MKLNLLLASFLALSPVGRLSSADPNPAFTPETTQPSLANSSSILISLPTGWSLVVDPGGGGALSCGTSARNSFIISAGTLDFSAIYASLASASPVDDQDAILVNFRKSGKSSSFLKRIAADSPGVRVFFANAEAALEPEARAQTGDLKSKRPQF